MMHQGRACLLYSGDVDTVVEMLTTRCYKFIYKLM